jgi:hypothetical protein
MKQLVILFAVILMVVSLNAQFTVSISENTPPERHEWPGILNVPLVTLNLTNGYPLNLNRIIDVESIEFSFTGMMLEGMIYNARLFYNGNQVSETINNPFVDGFDSIDLILQPGETVEVSLVVDVNAEQPSPAYIAAGFASIGQVSGLLPGPQHIHAFGYMPMYGNTLYFYDPSINIFSGTGSQTIEVGQQNVQVYNSLIRPCAPDISLQQVVMTHYGMSGPDCLSNMRLFLNDNEISFSTGFNLNEQAIFQISNIVLSDDEDYQLQVLADVNPNLHAGNTICLGIADSMDIQAVTPSGTFIHLNGTFPSLGVTTGFRPTDFQWAYGDTLYLLPQESLGVPAGIQTSEVCYLEFYTSISGAMVTNSTLSAFTQDILNDLGYYQYQEGQTSFQANWVSDNPVAIPLIMPIVYIYVNGFDYDNIPNPGNIYSAAFLISMNYTVSWYDAVSHTWETNNGSKSITVRFHNRKKGDVDNSGDSTQADLAVAMYLFTHGYIHYQLNGDNMAAMNVCVPWVTPFNFWLYNVWLNDPDNSLVADLGIGQDFPLTSGTYQNITPVINDRVITITPEGNQNTFSVLGRHTDGSDWTETIQISGQQRNHWISDQTNIEPRIEQNDRTDVQFTMPDDVTFVRAIASTLDSSTSNTDSLIPIAVPNLSTASPNPFNTQTTIGFTMPKSGNVNIEVYNVKGQLVRSLVNETKATGSHNIIWNGTDQNGQPVSSGVYFYKMDSGKYTATRKVMLVK